MKRALPFSMVAVVLLAAAFQGGRFFQNASNGYHYSIREEKDYDSPMGPVYWSYVTESVGLPFLDPGTTVIQFGDRTIYKARRVFQESYPFAENIKTSDHAIAWEDGEYRFNLTVTTMPEFKGPR